MKEIRIKIPKKVESLNKLLKMHWAQRKRHNGDWQAWVKIKTPKSKPKWTGLVGVGIRSLRARLLDKDNLFGGCKPVVDALKKNGLIRDDTPKDIDLYCTQKAVKKEDRGTVITLKGEAL